VGETAISGLLDAEILSQLNRAQYDLGWRLADGAMPGLTVRAAGVLVTSRLALPAAFWRERTLKIGDYYAQRWNVSELDELTSMAAPTTSNVFYYIWHHTDAPYIIVELGDADSAAAYVLHYIKYPTTVTTDIDPDFRVGVHHLLEDFTVVECLKLRRRPGEAEAIFANYLADIRMINSRYQEGKPYEGEPGDPK